MKYLKAVGFCGAEYEHFDEKTQNWWNNMPDRSVLDDMFGETLALYTTSKETLHDATGEITEVTGTKHFDMFVLEDGSYLLVGKNEKKQTCLILCE